MRGHGARLSLGVRCGTARYSVVLLESRRKVIRDELSHPLLMVTSNLDSKQKTADTI